MTDSICLRCKHKRYCETGVTQPSKNSYVTGCSRFDPKPPYTNADKIRAMTDEELAKYMTQETESYLSGAGNYWLEWLKQEADE